MTHGWCSGRESLTAPVATWRCMPAGGAVALLLLVAACDPGPTMLVDPAGGAAGATLEVRVLGPDGTPAADARVLYFVADRYEQHWQSTRAGADGTARLEGVLPNALFWLAAEQADAAWGAFAGAAHTHAPRRGASALVEVQLHHPPEERRLLFSEFYLSAPPLWDLDWTPYEASKYLEIANDSDEVYYLDGMLIGKVFHWFQEPSQFGHNACSDTEPMRLDPRGVWSSSIFQFPGSGADYPIAPGEAVVVAVSATDHRSIHAASMHDLSGAQFEFLLDGFADNPAAGNMIHLGPEPYIQHLTMSYSNAFWFVSDPADVNTLERRCNPGETRRCIEYVLIPREILHDVVFLLWDYSGHSYFGYFLPRCDYAVHPSFERMMGGFVDYLYDYRSAQRRRVMTQWGSRLLDTNTSRIDFEMAPRSPGRLP
jgi:hypothetical protein